MDPAGHPFSSSHSDQVGNTQAVVPPYWQHRRYESYSSVGHLRPTPISLEDNTEEQSASTSPLWAKAVSIHHYSLVSGNIPSVGDYVVWDCRIEMLHGGSMIIRKRYSEFEDLRSRLLATFPNAGKALPPIPEKNYFLKFKPSFLEKRRIGLAYFLKLALRSSGLDLNELPSTVIQRNPSPFDPRKRTRPFSNDHQCRHPTKKARKEPIDTSTTTRSGIKTYGKRPGTRPNPNAVPADEPVTQSTPNSPTPPAQPAQVVQPTLHPPPTTKFEERKPQDVKKVDKRSLRSHDGGSRFKSELALYFADYDEILTDQPKTQEFLTPQTLIHIVDESSKPSTSTILHSLRATKGEDLNGHTSADHRPKSRLIHGGSAWSGLDLNGAERLDFSAAERHTRQVTEDPLTDEVYFKAHRRAERGEKQHRNREKESAQHEQSQLERILEGLQGHAWLKTMGITGITDSERKMYEPKRLIFVQRVTALLNKFRAWKEEEKRRRSERERASTADDDEENGLDQEEEEDDDGDAAEGSDRSSFIAGLDGMHERNTLTRRRRTHSTSRAKRTHDPVRGRVSTISNSSRSQRLNALPPPVDKPFTSFFSKPYLREAALSTTRRGRLRFAFGQQIPELKQHEFSLPPGMLTTKVLRANARSKRAAKREIRDQ
ncbi:MAG: hypothetical protein Q9212_005772 [Teloschistes hypoglaucus]